jgi:D-alanyl-D-alanine dipeptidase
MVSTYDETTDRAYPDYPAAPPCSVGIEICCGQLWSQMDSQFFEAEWWHFDYKDWKKYRMELLLFDQINSAKQ